MGKGVEAAALATNDIELVGVFSRRDPSCIKTKTGIPVYSVDELDRFEGKIDVLMICGGSATDLPEMTPALAERFNVVDSFDTHAAIPTHFERVDRAARESGHIALISAGWDPGLFSLARLYFSSILPNGKDYTFWGRGVSQGHSDAIRRVEGVLDARQYTVPVPAALSAVRSGENPELSTRQKHTRECYVVAKEGADLEKIEQTIKNMPNYFADYDTTVTFISKEEMDRDHSGIPHGGSVIRSGNSGVSNENSHLLELNIRLDSNPEFTAGVLVAGARAIARMSKRGDLGCKTMFDLAPADLSPLLPEELRATML